MASRLLLRRVSTIVSSSPSSAASRFSRFSDVTPFPRFGTSGRLLLRYSSTSSTVAEAASSTGADSSSSLGSFDSSELIAGLKEMSSRAYEWSSATPGMIPAGTSLAACGAAWVLLPRVLRRLHRYVEQGPTARLLGRDEKQHPYDMSVWAALEDPTRLFVTVVAFSRLAALVAPTTVAQQSLGMIWNGGLIVSGLWFLYRWKSIVFSRKLLGQATTKDELERYMALDTLSSVAIVVLGAMALAETSGVAVQSILTVGGIGGLATAFAASTILGNALSGLALQFLKPFSVGDVISAGTIEGQVTEVGWHSTSVLNADKCPFVVPNTFLMSQVILNKSRAAKQLVKSRIYINVAGISKVPSITAQVVDYLKAHPGVKSEPEAPLCYISRFNPDNLEITMSYEIVHTQKKPDVLALEQEILVKAAQIFEEEGAALGAPPKAGCCSRNT